MSVQIINKPLVTELNDDDNILAQSAGGVTKRISFRSLAKQANFVINDIGKAGGLCFGVGIAPRLPVYLEPLPGTFVKGDEYGNYKCVTDGSIIDYVPKFYFKISNDTAAPYYGNKVEIKSALDFPDEATANAAGYALHRAFIDAGIIRDGFFIDKYNWSLTNFANGTSGIASSVKNGNPISSAVGTKRETKGITSVTSDAGSNSYKVTCIGGHGAVNSSTIGISGTGLLGLDTSFTIGYTNLITNINSAGTTAAVTTAQQHGLETGDSVKVSGTGITAYDKTAAITKTGTNTFTYTIDSTTNNVSVGIVTYNPSADNLRFRVIGATGIFSGSATLSKLLFAGSFSNCISNAQTPTDIYGGAWAAAKSRGADFAVATMFQHSAISLLALAHAQASTSAVNCAWYDNTNAKNFPKGNNQNGIDVNDNTVTFEACDDAYWAGRNEARKTGSGSNFAKTTHNGQNCGVSGLNGNQYTIYQGLTCIAVDKAITSISKSLDANDPAVFTAAGHGYSTNGLVFIDGDGGTEYNTLLLQGFFNVDVINADTFKLKIRSTTASDGTYVNTSSVVATYASGLVSRKGNFLTLKESVAVKNVTGGTGGANDHFGNAALFDVVDMSAGLVDKYNSHGFGNATNQVLNMDINRTNNNYMLSSLGLPGSKTALGGSNEFGNDWYYKYIRDGLCPIAGGDWVDGSYAGVWYLLLCYNRGNSGSNVSGRSCLYV